MTVDPEQLLSDGYIILREVIPPDELENLRSTFETMVTRQRELWSRESKAGDPPGGVWETSAQPRLQFETLVSADTSTAAEFCLHQNTMGVSQQIMRSKLASSTGMMLMCNPVRDHGPAHWHRDIHPIDQAPLSGLQHDLLQNAPGYVQWNIPLYDDEVLWVVPGSHRRLNTPEENLLLNENPKQPLPNGLQVKLQAGDGVVYTNTILHWGSSYSTRLRRTIHLGYRSFGGPIFPYVNRMLEHSGFVRHLSSDSQDLFENFEEAYNSETNVLVGLFQAVIDRDESKFIEGLSTLHPGQKGRIVCCVLLSKIVYKMRFGTHPDRAAYGGDISQDGKMAARFSDAEIETLWQRFSELDRAIQSEEDQFVPGFQSGPMKYNFNDMPPNFGIKEFMASWA